MSDPKKLMAEVFAALATNNVTTLPGLPASDPMKKIGAAIESIFGVMVDDLRRTATPPQVRQLMALAWDLFENKVVVTAIGPDVPSIHMTIYRQDGKMAAMVLIPKHWLQMVQANLYEQLGALVFTASQCADFYHGKGTDDRADLVARAKAYESEYLLSVPKAALKLTGYQRGLLDEYPKGLANLATELAYPLTSYQAKN